MGSRGAAVACQQKVLFWGMEIVGGRFILCACSVQMFGTKANASLRQNTEIFSLNEP
jgi:hypothetical protein